MDRAAFEKMPKWKQTNARKVCEGDRPPPLQSPRNTHTRQAKGFF